MQCSSPRASAGFSRLEASTRRLYQIRGKPFLVVEQNFEYMLRRQPLLLSAQRQRLCSLYKPTRPLRVIFQFHNPQLPPETLPSQIPYLRRIGYSKWDPDIGHPV